MHEGVRADERAPDRRIVHGRPHDRDLTAGRVDLAGPGPQKSDVGMSIEVLVLERQTLRHRDVVGIEPRQERRAGQLDRPNQRARQSLPRPALETQARIAQRCEHVRCRVRRAVVDDDQLEIRELL